MTKITKYLTILGSGIISVLLVILQTLRLKSAKEDLKQEKAASGAKDRQIKVNRKQREKAVTAIHEARTKSHTPADINQLLDD